MTRTKLLVKTSRPKMAPKCLGPKLVARNTEVAVVSVACFLLFVSSLTDVAGFVSKLVLMLWSIVSAV